MSGGGAGAEYYYSSSSGSQQYHSSTDSHGGGFPYQSQFTLSTPPPRPATTSARSLRRMTLKKQHPILLSESADPPCSMTNSPPQLSSIEEDRRSRGSGSIGKVWQIHQSSSTSAEAVNVGGPANLVEAAVAIVEQHKNRRSQSPGLWNRRSSPSSFKESANNKKQRATTLERGVERRRRRRDNFSENFIAQEQKGFLFLSASRFPIHYYTQSVT